jgi:hypothetical protein
MYLLLSYFMAAMVAWCPLSNHYWPPSSLTHQEIDAKTTARYESIAKDLEDVLNTEKPLFAGPLGKVKTGLLVLSVASYESGFTEKVDNTSGSGDHGQSHCIMQILYPLRPGEVMNDRKDCFRLGITRLRESMAACPNSDVRDKLAVYARGRCDSPWGITNSRMKMYRAMSWLTGHPYMLPVDDAAEAHNE